ncbi:MAG: hypothetical protein NTY14_08070, partial [Candidatus Omnitrophica bacterium]|nr:hypothetical protein [Candidatus Omnitrophota bacterium]
MNNFKKYLITGLVVVIPFSLTIYLLVAIFQFLDNILGIFLVDYLKKSWGFYVPGIGFLLFALLILLVGMLATKFLK